LLLSPRAVLLLLVFDFVPKLGAEAYLAERLVAANTAVRTLMPKTLRRSKPTSFS
jgi:hypothetical protein